MKILKFALLGLIAILATTFTAMLLAKRETTETTEKPEPVGGKVVTNFYPTSAEAQQAIAAINEKSGATLSDESISEIRKKYPELLPTILPKTEGRK